MSNSFGNTLRSLRNSRKKSQLDLSLDAGISSKHLSFLESGRALPGREMVRKLTEALEISHPYKNILFLAAGFSSDFEFPKNEESETADPILFKQIGGTAPILIVNWESRVVKTNPALKLLISALKGFDFRAEGLSLTEFLLSDFGLGPHLLDSQALSHRILTCSYLENFVSPYESAVKTPDPESTWFNNSNNAPISIRLEYNGIIMFEVLQAASGHPFEVNTRSHRIYTWVPSDRFTENTMRDLISSDSDFSESAACEKRNPR
ncbi:helix-turn-helix transcriptional regulator [Leptospira sp. 201903070]|uniref:Helix-turn-helix transcriptional regulator n=1 Tax=Leptospira ainlahdjerensis TaxID=2810033 RepID=A0ABS2UC60_9LEPT|nr:helix-turn-helix transcriptional regulator [Leptospira ainlahdjerensis]MBM9577384.1 helix-turn-helix transcriptional regulator [Leptospira ainlahdjerensis]